MFQLAPGPPMEMLLRPFLLQFRFRPGNRRVRLRKRMGITGPPSEVHQLIHPGPDPSWTTNSFFLSLDSLVEVRGSEEGFLGSWYAARVLEAKEGRQAVRLHLCYLAFQEEDGSLWEDWLDHPMVRPMPPNRSDDFVDALKKGSALEVNIEEGWWEVELVSREGPNFLVESKRYKVQHVVQIEKLRPAWRWDEKARQWGILERLTQGKNEKGAPPTKVPKQNAKGKK